MLLPLRVFDNCCNVQQVDLSRVYNRCRHLLITHILSLLFCKYSSLFVTCRNYDAPKYRYTHISPHSGADLWQKCTRNG